jgi:osomolarity two-component system response regulator SKN7
MPRALSSNHAMNPLDSSANGQSSSFYAPSHQASQPSQHPNSNSHSQYPGHGGYNHPRDEQSSMNGWPPMDRYQAAGPSSRPDAYQQYQQIQNQSQQIRLPSPGNGPSSRLPHPVPHPLDHNGWSSIHPSSSASRGGQHSQVPIKTEDSADRMSTSSPQVNTRLGHGRIGALTSQPLDVIPLREIRPDSGSGVNPEVTPLGGGGGGPAGPSEFIKKLYRMLEDESATYGRGRAAGQPRGDGALRGSVGWGRGGTTFVVWDMNDFTTKIL